MFLGIECVWLGTRPPATAPQPRVEQVAHRIAEHVETVNGNSQGKTGPESQPWRYLHELTPLPG